MRDKINQLDFKMVKLEPFIKSLIYCHELTITLWINKV